MSNSALPSSSVEESPNPNPDMSRSALWEEVQLSEEYLVCCMGEEAASLASSILQHLYVNSPIDLENSEREDLLLSAGMVYVQSLHLLGRTSELFTRLKDLFGSVAAIPGEVFLTGACMQISEGYTSTLKEVFDEFLGVWNYEAGKSYVLPNADRQRLSFEGLMGRTLSTDDYFEIVEIYAIALLGKVLHDTNLAISWVEKAELPEEKRQEMLRRLHSLNSSALERRKSRKETSSRVVSGTESTLHEAEGFPYQNKDDLKSAMKSSPSSIKQSSGWLKPSFWWFYTVHPKSRTSQLSLPHQKIMFWSSLLFFTCYILGRKRATLRRIAARYASSVRRALIDLWQLAFSVHVNPLAAVQPLPNAPPGSR